MDASERDKTGEMLSAYLDGELSGEQVEAIERLIADDAEARALLVELREAADSVRQLPRAVAPSGILTEIQERVERQELLGPPDQPVTLSRHQRRPLRSILATAAALVITVGGGLWAISKLGGPQEQQHAGRSANDDQLRMQRELVNFPQSARDLKSTSSESSSELNEGAETYFAKRADVERPSNASEPQSAVRSIPARVPTGASLAEKSRGLQPVVDGEYRLGLEQSPELKAGDQMVGGRFDVADQVDAGGGKSARPEAEQMKAKAGAETREPMNEEFGLRTATLEQKLTRDVTVGELLDHPFANEPLRLEIQVAGAEQVPKIAKRVRALIRSGDDRQLGYSAQSKMRAAPLDVQPGRPGDKTLALGADRPLVMEGEPQHNFQPAAKGETQYLARVDTDTLERILDATRDGGGAIIGRRFAVGRIQAESDQEVERLAAMTLGEDYPNRSAGAGGAFEFDATGPADADQGTTVDLAELLRGIGVGPPDVSEFGVGTGESPDSKEAPPAETERQFADAADDSNDDGIDPPSAAAPGAPSQEGVSTAVRRRGMESGDSRKDEKADESEAPRTDEGVALSAQESAGQSAPNRQPSDESGNRGSESKKSEVRESETRKSRAKESESKGQSIDALASETEQIAMRNKLTPESRSSPPLYTIVIRFVPVQSQNGQQPNEPASPTPTASPGPVESKSVEPESANPE